MRRSTASFALVCSLVACAKPSAPASSAPAAAVKPALPSDLAVQVHQAEQLGRAIFEQDLAASRASDALLEALNGEPDARIRGFITRRDGARWRVQFFGGESSDPSERPTDVLWQADLGAFGAGVSLDRLATPQPLDAEGQRMARARITATSQHFEPCSSRYDAVILPASMIGKDGFLVYLLATNAARGEWMVGGHQRYLISEDGSAVVGHQSLSRSCLSVPASRKPEGSSSGAWVTHVVSDAPAETHVFLSLLHQSPLFVGTRRGVWRVAGEKISFEGS
jgi:hypothetical protein